jgi:hypothetical protein
VAAYQGNREDDTLQATSVHRMSRKSGALAQFLRAGFDLSGTYLPPPRRQTPLDYITRIISLSHNSMTALPALRAGNAKCLRPELQP